jgi:hypothetical protein
MSIAQQQMFNQQLKAPGEIIGTSTDERNYTFSIHTEKKKETTLRHLFHPAIVNRRLDSASNPSLINKKRMLM